MLVKTIVDNESGRKWEIVKHEADRYSVKYYEFFQSIGWRLTTTDRDYSKACIEYMFDCPVA